MAGIIRRAAGQQSGKRIAAAARTAKPAAATAATATQSRQKSRARRPRAVRRRKDVLDHADQRLGVRANLSGVHLDLGRARIDVVQGGDDLEHVMDVGRGIGHDQRVGRFIGGKGGFRRLQWLKFLDQLNDIQSVDGDDLRAHVRDIGNSFWIIALFDEDALLFKLQQGHDGERPAIFHHSIPFLGQNLF